MGFQQGLSGLAAASKNLDVIGHNIANAGTYGFKAQRAEFADLVASGLGGAQGGDGLGTRLAQVSRQFSQGNISTTGNALDLAVNGDGLFRVSDSGTIAYTRNGQFRLDSDGYLVNADGARLTGYAADASGILGMGTPAELRVQTQASSPSATTEATAVFNLDAREAVPAVAFSPANPASFSFSSTFAVHDSLGNARSVNLYFVKTADGAWDVHGTSDGAALGVLGSMAFDASGNLTAGSTMALALPSAGGSAPVAATVDFSGTTQFGSPSEATSLSQNGTAPGSLSGFGVAADGTIYGTYSNGKTKTLGQIALASFPSPNGLAGLGGNLLGETSASGQPLLGPAGSGRLGAIQAGALEESNVDLTEQLVAMITAQRNYQANAQTIKAQDAIMQTLVNLR